MWFVWLVLCALKGLVQVGLGEWCSSSSPVNQDG